MKKKIIKINKNTEKNFKIFCRSLIKKNIFFKSKIINLYLKDLKKLSLKNHIFLLSKINNQSAGILVCNNDNKTGIATIIWVIVDKKFQKQSLGKDLIKRLIQNLNKHKIHKLRVFSYKKELNSFYIKMNFINEGFYKNHWFKNNFWSFGKLISK